MRTINRIAIIGNGGGGKTTLARELALKFDLPLMHVDSIQFLPGMRVRDTKETSEILNSLADADRWLIDGFGSREVMERRFRLADNIIFVDFPLWRHYWWCTKRQVKCIFTPRKELPLGCDEGTLSHALELYKILWRVHTKIRPSLQAFFQHAEIRPKVIHITNIRQWNNVFRGDLG